MHQQIATEALQQAAAVWEPKQVQEQVTELKKELAEMEGRAGSPLPAAAWQPPSVDELRAQHAAMKTNR